jgi:hypothetical protein
MNRRRIFGRQIKNRRMLQSRRRALLSPVWSSGWRRAGRRRPRAICRRHGRATPPLGVSSVAERRCGADRALAALWTARHWDHRPAPSRKAVTQHACCLRFGRQCRRASSIGARRVTVIVASTVPSPAARGHAQLTDDQARAHPAGQPSDPAVACRVRRSGVTTTPSPLDHDPVGVTPGADGRHHAPRGPSGGSCAGREAHICKPSS